MAEPNTSTATAIPVPVSNIFDEKEQTISVIRDHPEEDGNSIVEEHADVAVSVAREGHDQIDYITGIRFWLITLS